MNKILKITILCAVLSIFGATAIVKSNEISSPTNHIPQPFDVLSYDAFVDLSSFPSTYVEGKCVMAIKWNENPKDKKVFFHLRDLTVDSVFYGDLKVENLETIGEPKDTTYHHEFKVLFSKSNNPIPVTIYYHGNMTVELNNQSMKWGGVQYRDNILFAMGVGFYNNYVSSTQHWLPCYDLPSDKAKFKCKFIVPAGKFVASNGLLTNVENLDNGTDTYTWEHNNDCATYNFTFALGDYKEVNFGNGELPMTVYSLAQDTTNTKIVFKLLPRMVETYEKRFGKYPFDKVGYVLTPIGSMEHETMISFAYKLVRFSTDTVNETGAHELAHMWFGDMVTPFDFRDAWLNESFATFCEAIWYEELFGFESYLDHLDFMRGFYITNQSGSKNEGVFPLYDFPRIPPSSNYPVTIYYKGGVIVSMLRYELGDSLFFASISKYLDSAKYGNATTEFLISVCEQVSGKELDWFFNQWIYSRGWLQLNVNFVPSGENYKLKLTQVQPFDTWEVFQNVPVEIGFIDSEGKTTYKMFNLTETEQVFDVELGFQCNRITINKGLTIRSLLEVKAITYTAVEDIQYSKVDLYPNPTDSQIVVVFNSGDGIAEIKIYDSQGKEVMKSSLNTRKGSNQYIIDTNTLINGNYYIMIETDLSMVREKFVVIH
jgi:aminopeptidase N